MELGEPLLRAEDGAAAAAIREYIRLCAARRLGLQGLSVLQNGHVLYRGTLPPYTADDQKHVYSVSKSFTATAVGFAAAEGLLSLDDPAIRFFPEVSGADDRLSRARIRDFLTMATGHTEDTVYALCAAEKNWAETFFAQPAAAEPGTRFVYNSGASYILSAVITKVSGQSLADYLRPRLFEPLGIRVHWEQSPDGCSLGGWGLYVSLKDFEKFGLLYLQDGLWEGRRLLPEGWAKAVSSFQIGNAFNAHADIDQAQQGYGFQFWCGTDGMFRADGAFGQYILMAPRENAVICIQSCSGTAEALDEAIRLILPALGESGEESKALPELPAEIPAEANVLPPEPPEEEEPFTLTLDENPYGLRTLALLPEEGGIQLLFGTARGVFRLHGGANSWRSNEVTQFPFCPAFLLNPGSYDGVISCFAGRRNGSFVMRLVFRSTVHGAELEITPGREKVWLRNEINTLIGKPAGLCLRNAEKE